MALKKAGRDAVERGVTRKEKFDQGNVWARWVNRHHYQYDSAVGELPQPFVAVLNEHSKNAELFVVYSYNTPIAWYSLSRSEFDTENLGTNGTGKWYYVNHRYSVSTNSHQSATRYALLGENVVTLSLDNDRENVVETEQEFYQSPLKS